MTLKESLPILQAIADGAEWQWLKQGCAEIWMDSSTSGYTALAMLDLDYKIRIKPAPAPPEYVPLDNGDIPPGSVLRSEGFNSDEWMAITSVINTAIYIGQSRRTYQDLFSDYEINCSIPFTGKWDATAWEPCKKLKQ